MLSGDVCSLLLIIPVVLCAEEAQLFCSAEKIPDWLVIVPCLKDAKDDATRLVENNNRKLETFGAQNVDLQRAKDEFIKQKMDIKKEVLKLKQWFDHALDVLWKEHADLPRCNRLSNYVWECRGSEQCDHKKVKTFLLDDVRCVGREFLALMDELDFVLQHLHSRVPHEIERRGTEEEENAAMRALHDRPLRIQFRYLHDGLSQILSQLGLISRTLGHFGTNNLIKESSVVNQLETLLRKAVHEDVSSNKDKTARGMDTLRQLLSRISDN